MDNADPRDDDGMGRTVNAQEIERDPTAANRETAIFGNDDNMLDPILLVLVFMLQQ